MTYKKTKYQNIDNILSAEKAGKKYCKFVKELRDYLLTGSNQTTVQVEEIKSKISKAKDRLDDYKERIDRDSTKRKIKDEEYLYGKPVDSGEVEELEIVCEILLQYSSCANFGKVEESKIIYSVLYQYLSGGYDIVLSGRDVDNSFLTGDSNRGDDASE